MYTVKKFFGCCFKKISTPSTPEIPASDPEVSRLIPLQEKEIVTRYLRYSQRTPVASGDTALTVLSLLQDMRMQSTPAVSTGALNIKYR